MKLSDSSTAAGGTASDFHWFVSGAILTAGLAVFSLAQLPDYSAVIVALDLLKLWMIIAAAMGALILAMVTIRMMAAGQDRPIAAICAMVVEQRGRLFLLIPGLLLTGFNMIVFMLIKQVLNQLVPFWADPYLAAADRLIFLTDPWRLLVWLDSFPFALFYHRGWFALMILGLLKVLWASPSEEKTALMLTYFLLWSVFGPVVHTLLPAAGPVFYSHLGYGDRFANLEMATETQRLADYLWSVYRNGTFAPGAGISAMPSLHIATIAWVVIAIHKFAPRWLFPTAAMSALIFILSVALGWHYAVDGLVGFAGAYGLWRASLWLVRIRPFPASSAAEGA